MHDRRYVCLLNLVEDPSLVVVHSVVLDGLMDKTLLQSVDNFNVIESDDNSAAGPARDVGHLVCLNRDLHVLKGRQNRQLNVVPRLGYRVE